MGRTKGSLNKGIAPIPDTISLTTEERLQFLANLIVDRIIEDQSDSKRILKKIGHGDAAQRAS
jgi:hypothetical protein